MERVSWKDAMKSLGYKSRRSLYYQIEKKRLTKYRTPLGRVYFDLEEIKKLKRDYLWT